MYKLCLVSDVEVEALKETSKFMRELGRVIPSTHEDMYLAANMFDNVVDNLWSSGVEFSPNLISAVMQWKERNENATA